MTGNQAGNNIQSHLNARRKPEHMSESEEHSHVRICEGWQCTNMLNQQRKKCRFHHKNRRNQNR